MQGKKKKNIKVRDLKPKKDAKGGFNFTTGPGRRPAGPGLNRPGRGN